MLLQTGMHIASSLILSKVTVLASVIVACATEPASTVTVSTRPCENLIFNCREQIAQAQALENLTGSDQDVV